jgi:alanine dehydrogenase
VRGTDVLDGRRPAEARRAKLVTEEMVASMARPVLIDISIDQGGWLDVV